tara:strand:+ start:484 stop:1188 length:705 start_codon:yes stop_codon:yes gene_type:complete
VKILIAIPSYDGKVICNLAVTMAEIFRVAESKGYELFFHCRMFESVIQKSRNTLLAKAYKENYDYIVFIDSDQAFTSSDFYALLSHNVDCCGLPVILKSDKEDYNIQPFNPLKALWDSELGLLEVEAVGTGFMKLSRKAIKTLWDEAEPYTHNTQGEIRNICQLRVEDGKFVGEDWHLCGRLRANGIPIYIDPTVTVEHVGTKKWTGDYIRYCEQDRHKAGKGEPIESVTRPER